MEKVKARLKQVRLENISKFKDEQTVNFKTGNTFTFIGKHESGTVGFIEAIRRCCETNINYSFSCAYDDNSPSIVVCTFESEMGDVEENKNTSNIDSKEDSTTKSSNGKGCERLEHTKYEANDKEDGKSNVLVQNLISQRAAEILKTNVEPTEEMTAHSGEIAANSNVDGGSTKSQTLVSIYIQRKVNNSAQEALKVLVLRKGKTFSSASIVLSIIKDKPEHVMMHQPSAILDQYDYERILTGNVDLKTVIGILEKLMDGERGGLKTDENKFDKIFHDFVGIEFLFLYRVNAMQSSEQIKTCLHEVTYKQASANSYVIREFIKNKNQECYDKELEKKIFERLNIHKDVEFEYDEEKEILNVVIGSFTHSILKAPADMLAAKYLSIALSKRKAILIIAEPGRDMHLEMTRRMVNLVFQDKTMLGGAMVILTTHSKDFLTPINLEHTFIVMNNVDDGSKIRKAKPDNKNEGKEYLTCRILSLLVVCDRILFVEGQSDLNFVETMLHIFMNNMDLTDAYLKALQEELKDLSLKQLMSFLLSLKIEKMDGSRNMNKINNACKYLGMLQNRFFLLDFDTIFDIHKYIKLTDQKSFSLADLEKNGIFVWDDDLVETSETVENTHTSDKGTQCTGSAVKMFKPGTLEDVIIRFSIHHDLLYHAESGQCLIESCEGLVVLLKSKNMVSFKPWSMFEFIIEKNVTDKGKDGKGKDKGEKGKDTVEGKHEKLVLTNKFLLAETQEDISTIVSRLIECSISNREGQIWRLLKFIGAKACDTRPAKPDNAHKQGPSNRS